jgi:PAS domain S-box-containing protein
MDHSNLNQEALLEEISRLRTRVSELEARIKEEEQHQALLKKTPMVLSDSEKTLAEFLKNFPGSVYIKDADRRIIYLTEKVRDYFGIEPSEWLGKTSEQIWPPELAAQVRREDEAALRGEYTQSLVERPHKDGIHTWLVNRFPIHRENAPPLIGCISIDITEKKKMEVALGESEVRFQQIFDQAPIGIALIDSTTGQFTHINQKYCDIVGYKLEEMLRLSFQAITHPDDLQEDLSQMEKLKNGVIDSFTMEKRYLKKGGKAVWVSLIVAPLWRKGEKASHHVAMVTDITEKKQIEAQAVQSQKLEAIGVLAGGIAHDFNNILASMTAFAELTLEKVENERLRSYLWRILEGCNRATELVRQILTFSRHNKQEEMLLDLKIIANETFKLLRAALPSTIEIQKHFCDEPCLVKADLTQIHQLLMNLSTNAADAMRDEGGLLQIELNVEDLTEDTKHTMLKLKPGTYVRITIRDTGQGIDPSILQNIFQPFFTTKATGEGTGMGLAVAHGIAKSCSGTIHVESEPGLGSSFSVYLPKANIVSGGISMEEIQAPRGKGNILVVDDEIPNGIALKEILDGLGYNTEVTNNSRDALDIFSANPQHFDLVISDVTMPGMTGDQLARKILQINPDSLIILQTGYGERISEKECEEIGVVSLLTKPVRKANLAKAVKDVLDTYHSQ